MRLQELASERIHDASLFFSDSSYLLPMHAVYCSISIVNPEIASAGGLAVSLTVTRSKYFPATIGFPLTAPLEESRLRPGGIPVELHAYGFIPPVVANRKGTNTCGVFKQGELLSLVESRKDRRAASATCTFIVWNIDEPTPSLRHFIQCGRASLVSWKLTITRLAPSVPATDPVRVKPYNLRI